MRGAVRLTVYPGKVSVAPPGGEAVDVVPASIQPGETSLSIVPEGGPPLELAYTDIDELFDDNYTLRLTDHTGRRYDLSMLGRAYGQIAADVSKRRRDLLQRDLLLTGVGKMEAFPGAIFGRGEPERAELRLFDDLLVVIPERSLMWGLPYSFVDSVEWDADRYQVVVRDDQGTRHAFGWMAKRSEEFLENLRDRLGALARRTARTLGALMPGLDPSTLGELARAMRDGRALQQWRADAIDPSLWPRLEEVVVGTEELRATYGALKAMTPPGWAAVGVKASEVDVEAEDLPDVEFRDAGDASAATERESRSGYQRRVEEERRGATPRIDLEGLEEAVRAAVGTAQAQPGAAPPGGQVLQEAREDAEPGDLDPLHPAAPKARLWYFCPLAPEGRPVNAVAQEVTSEGGHATYVFRLMERDRWASLDGQALADEVATSIARLNRALLTLNFRREPIYLPEDQLEEGRHARYRVALRKLDYLRWARGAFLGRAIHTSEAAWKSQLEEAIASA